MTKIHKKPGLELILFQLVSKKKIIFHLIKKKNKNNLIKTKMTKHLTKLKYKNKN